MIKTARPGATFLLNTPWTGAELEEKLPTKMKETIASRDLKFYTIDATKVAKEIGSLLLSSPPLLLSSPPLP